MNRTVVLSAGMGVESTVVAVRWLLEPASRDFDLADLVLVTAMTGIEYRTTARLMHIMWSRCWPPIGFATCSSPGPRSPRSNPAIWFSTTASDRPGW